MRISVYTTYDPSKKVSGGYDSRIHSLTNYLKSNKIDHNIIYSNNFRSFTKNITKSHNDKFRSKQSITFILSILYRLFCYRIINKKSYKAFIRNIGKKDFIDFQNIRLAAPYILTLKNKAKIIITSHYIVNLYFYKIGYANLFTKKIIEKIEVYILKKADAVICFTQSEKEYLYKMGIKRIFVSPITSKTKNSKNSITEYTHNVLFVGSNMPSNQDSLNHIVAIASLCNEFNFFIAGKICDYANTIKLALPSNIKLLGYLSEKDLEHFFDMSTFFAIPMLNGEGFSTKALLAFSYGKIVLSTENGVRGTNAIDGVHYYKCDTDNDIINRLRLLSANKSNLLNISCNAKYLSEQFSDDVVFSKYINFLQEL